MKASLELLRALACTIYRQRATESLARLGLAIGAWTRPAPTTAADVRRIRDAVDPVQYLAMRHAIRFDALSRSLEAAVSLRPISVLREALEIGELTAAEFTAYAELQPGDCAALDAAEKIAVVDALLERGVTLVQLDGRAPGVRVPPAHAANPRLILRIGRGLSPPITDLEVGLAALSCTLTFDRLPHHCVVPWAAVYAAASAEGVSVSWTASAPEDLAPPEPEAQPAPEIPASRRGNLRLVD